MIRIQTFGLLSEIMKHARAKGDHTVPRSELEAFFKELRVSNPAAFAHTWAEQNMMWAEFEYDTDLPDRRIVAVTFGSSK